MDYEVRLTSEFRTWLDGLADEIAKASVAERLLRAARGLFGDHASVGDRVSELRVHFGAGLRMYYTIRGRATVIILTGGTKRTQERDIRRAVELEIQVRGVGDDN